MRKHLRTLSILVTILSLIALSVPASADSPEDDLDKWIEHRAELGLSHASGARPELGPQIIGNPTEAVTVLRVGLRYSYTPWGTLSEFYSLNHPSVRLSNTEGAVHIIDLATEKQIAVMEPGMVFTVDHDGSGYVVEGPDGTIGHYSGPIRFRPSNPANLFQIETMRRLNILTWSGYLVPRYRGEIEITRGDRTAEGSVHLVNIVELEDYTRGVVINESPAFFHVEALKAQATAARGYAVANIGRWQQSGYPFDLDDSVRSQVYRGVVAEHPKGNAAVAESASLVASYQGRIITAFYSSSMGGHTENNEWIFNWPRDQFPGQNGVPYLRGIWDGPGEAPNFRVQGTTLYDEAAIRDFWMNPQAHAYDSCERVNNRFARWRIKIPAETIKARLGGRAEIVSGDLTGTVTGVEVLDRMDASGRIGIARVELTSGVADVKGWNNVRRVLGAAAERTSDPYKCTTRSIPAGWVLNNPSVIEPYQNDDGSFAGIYAYGGGWGHNVGLSQYGAHGRGLAGQNFIEILKAYYTGVDVGSYPIDISLRAGEGTPTLRQRFASPTGTGVLEIRPEGLKGLRVHFNESQTIVLEAEDLDEEVVRIDVSAYLEPGLNVVQYNPVGMEGSATVLVTVD